jgi:hypothetical protein
MHQRQYGSGVGGFVRAHAMTDEPEINQGAGEKRKRSRFRNRERGAAPFGGEIEIKGIKVSSSAAKRDVQQFANS